MVSGRAAEDIYGISLNGTGCDHAATRSRRDQIRTSRLAAAVTPDPGDAVISFKGTGRRTLDALVVDFDADTVTCSDCGHVHCSPSENLLPHLREICTPLKAAGPVRGEDYDVGRFRLRQLCCSGCGTMVDVQVALNGAPRPFFRIDSWTSPSALHQE